LSEQVLRTRQLLQGNDEEAAEGVLAPLGGQTQVEEQIAADLAADTPLADPDGFLPAHRRVMQALEVLELQGSRNPRVPNIGALTPLLALVVENMAGYMISNYAKDIATTLRSLYARRMVQCEPRTTERALLARARGETSLISDHYGGGGALVRILIAGAAVPVAGSLAQLAGVVDFGNGRHWLAILATLAVIFSLVVWVLLYSAATAHRRSRLIIAIPLAALWRTIGHCGDYPEADSRGFALLVIILGAIVWLALPVITALGVLVWWR
jgi:hypothetical protein